MADDWTPRPVYGLTGNASAFGLDLGGGNYEETPGSQKGREAFEAAQPYLNAQQDPNAMAAQRTALEQIGRRAFGGPEPGSEQAQEAAMISPYHAQAMQAGPMQARGLADALTTTGQAQLMGDRGALGLSQDEAQRRLGAQAAYGQQAGAMRAQQGNLAEFNAQQRGGLTTNLYDALYHGAMQQRQRQQEQGAQEAQGAEQVGIALASLIAMMSDERMKKNIKDGADDADRLGEALSPRSFRYRDESHGAGKHLGVMAQNVERAAPDMVHTGPDGMKRIDTVRLVGALAALAGHHDDRIKKLERR